MVFPNQELMVRTICDYHLCKNAVFIAQCFHFGTTIDTLCKNRHLLLVQIGVGSFFIF